MLYVLAASLKMNAVTTERQEQIEEKHQEELMS
jgi:hypothetical protein